ncbi:MAG TPA: hypothetical protein VK850_08480 [Candidatus Binatia bacterium]|nr:hypothetical protein [Candidatus Binatia bacterium]
MNAKHASVILAAALQPIIVPAADQWIDISTTLVAGLTNSGVKLPWPGGCSGVVVDWLKGDVVIKVVGQGLWRSSDQGATWKRIDNNTVSGRDETGWTTTVDQNDPKRMASFSLDGLAGWTTNGTDWNSFSNNGRNWDYGSVDWATPGPQTILAAKHETSPLGEVDLSTDGGVSWKKLQIRLAGKPNAISMLGVMDATTFVYCNGNGIHRSTDSGVTWTQVSRANPQTRISVLFKGVHYLSTTNGLLVTKDKGATWQSQGSAVNVWLGPFFGADENHMTVVGTEGVHATEDGGKTWTHVAALRPKNQGFSFSANWFGCYAWDPVHRIVYASAMGNPVYALRLDNQSPSK